MQNFTKNRTKLEKLDPPAMESFASKVLEIIKKEKTKSSALHDLQILEYNMAQLKNYAAALDTYAPDTDDYDFTKNDCKNLVDNKKMANTRKTNLNNNFSRHIRLLIVSE